MKGQSPSTRLMIAKMQGLAALGMTYNEAAEEIGASYHYVASFVNRHGIELRQLTRGRHPSSPDDRSDEMRALYQQGQTLQQIGEKFGVTRERVRQIIHKHYGMRGQDGGQAEVARKKRREFMKKRDARCIRAWGCNYRDYQTILKHPDQPTLAFSMQKRNARERGIGWELSLWQWWKIWEQSGHWADRGRGHGYCMCRLNDSGPYAVDNVYVATGAENMRDFWVKKRAAALQSDARVA